MGDFWCFNHFATDEMHHTKNVWYSRPESKKRSDLISQNTAI